MKSNKQGFTLNRYTEKFLLSIPTTTNNTQGRDPEQKLLRMALCKGFTLIELLIVVLIIGILSAIAVPQYQQAVLKGRFNGLMPITHAVVNAQEIYYMEHGNYATDITQLDIKAPSGGASASITVPGTEDPADFSYVLTSRADAPGVALVIYQRHSEQFPGAVMCEANDKQNSKATWLCQTALHGTLVESGSLQGRNWTAYLLSGEEGNSAFSACSGKQPDDIETSQSHAIGKSYCDEESGEWKYQWTKNGYIFTSGTTCGAGYSAYACANSIFRNAWCVGWAENSCVHSTFTGSSSLCRVFEKNGCSNSTFTSGAECVGAGENGCSNSTFTSGSNCYFNCQDSSFTGKETYCSGDCSNSMFSDGAYCTGSTKNGCSNSTFTDGASCKGSSNDVCANAIIQEGGYCDGASCVDAIYSGTGCCSNCPAGSNVPKCSSHTVTVQTAYGYTHQTVYDGGWDGKTYW